MKITQSTQTQVNTNYCTNGNKKDTLTDVIISIKVSRGLNLVKILQ